MNGLTDLACRSIGGSVVAASDEFFAEKENLIKPETPVHRPATFTLKGQEYDGWETRRRRDEVDAESNDWVMIRLGVPGTVSTVVIDTAFFVGNVPESASVEVLGVEGYPPPEELLGAGWTKLLPRKPLAGGTENAFEVDSGVRATHLRLRIFPDGGVARLRAYGHPVPDPRDFLDVPANLVGLTQGGLVISCSDSCYSSPNNMLQSGESRFMGDGWETARRRGPGNEWAVVALAGQAVPKVLELTTTHYKGNAPASATLLSTDENVEWFPLLPPVALQPDNTHRFRLRGDRAARQVRLEIAPDGGIGRMRLYGPLTDAGRKALALRWFNSLPDAQASELFGDTGSRRPVDELPPQVWTLLRG